MPYNYPNRRTGGRARSRAAVWSCSEVRTPAGGRSTTPLPLLALLVAIAVAVALPTTLAAQQTRVFDAAGLLDKEQTAAVQQALDRVSQQYDTDLFILTSRNLGGVSPKRHAESFFWDGNHGTREETGVVLVIDLGERDVWIATFGRAIATFQPDVNRIISAITPDLTAGRYAASFLAFADLMQKPLLEIVRPTYLQRAIGLAGTPIPWIAAGVVSLGLTILLSLNSRGKRLVTNKTYEVADSFHLTESADTYLRTTTSRVRVQSSSGSRGGGRSSGGGGGKF